MNEYRDHLRGCRRCRRSFRRFRRRQRRFSALLAPHPWPCRDCGVQTIAAWSPAEVYMVRDEVWAAAGMDPARPHGSGDILCIGCLETRLGRELHAGDFTDAMINDPERAGITPRLRNRLTRKPGDDA